MTNFIGRRCNKVFFYVSVPLCLCVPCLCVCVSVVNRSYRNFSVVNANSANTSDAIQKRTITFDSDHPINSK